MRLMDDYKKEPGQSTRLQERNPKVVNDDYVKFIRFAQEVISNEDNAVIAYATPHMKKRKRNMNPCWNGRKPWKPQP